jgi:hypothetical protein
MNWKDLEWSDGDLIKQHPGIWLEGLRKTMKNFVITGISADIRNELFQNCN